MANKTQTIRIESILGGESLFTHFSGPDQFNYSLGIDPWFGMTADPADIYGDSRPTGLLRPIGATKISGSVVQNSPLWMIPDPKNLNTIYVYDNRGSVYSQNIGGTPSATGLADLNDGGTAFGNGAAYYDNYIYFARDTTVARYGPLNGTPAFTDDYWVNTLGKTALTNTTYPRITSNVDTKLPNHVLHRHSDGKLYIADVVDNQGTLHYVKTSKTTVEGDTDAGSKYDAVNVGYGLWPTAMESYGSGLAIAFYEGASGLGFYSKFRAKVAFWDTTSENVNSITWVEYPDPLISAIKNVNGVLYFFSGNVNATGYRVLRYIGGSSFEEVRTFRSDQLPLMGGVDGGSDRLFFGSSSGLYSLGVGGPTFGTVFNVFNPTGSTSAVISAVSMIENTAFFIGEIPLVGWTTSDTSGINNGEKNGIDKVTLHDTSETFSVWWSQWYKIGQPFKITKIRIPLVFPVDAEVTITPSIFVDETAKRYIGGTAPGLAVINNENYSGKVNAVMRPTNLTGEHNFLLELEWTGSKAEAVNLPITIEYELLDD